MSTNENFLKKKGNLQNADMRCIKKEIRHQISKATKDAFSLINFLFSYTKA